MDKVLDGAKLREWAENLWGKQRPEYYLEGSPELLSQYEGAKDEAFNAIRRLIQDQLHRLQVANPLATPEQHSELQAQREMLNGALQRLEDLYDCIVVDPTVPANVMGYYEPDKEIIGINPLILTYARSSTIYESIFHVLAHEVAHGALELYEESITEFLSTNVQGTPESQGFASGYGSLVDKIKEVYIGYTAEDILALVGSTDEETLSSFVIAMFDPEELAKLHGAVDQTDSLRQLILSKWDIIKFLFPRLVNSVIANSPDFNQEVGYGFQALWNCMSSHFEEKMKTFVTRYLDESQEDPLPMAA